MKMEPKQLFANIALTIILGLVCFALLADLFAFWDDRTLFGNLTVLAAVCFVIGWFFLGLRNAW